MKTILATLTLTALIITTAWAGTDSTTLNTPSAETFSARVSLLKGDSIRFIILNPEMDDITVKVYSDHNIKVMEYDLENKKAVKLTYVMVDMRKCCYTAVVERNDTEVLRKKIEVK
jgi:hypothetical protein